jgi:hypothetical protein
MTDRPLRDGPMNTATTDGAGGDGEADVGWPELPQHDVGAATAARIRGRALATLRRRELAARSGSAKVWLWYERAFEPTLWLGLGLGYCAWAVAGALAVLR